jgi:hypothetical protein
LFKCFNGIKIKISIFVFQNCYFMKSRTNNIIIFISILSLSILLGSYILRLLLSYNIYDPVTLSFKEFASAESLTGIFSTLLPIFSITIVSYTIFVISFFSFLLVSRFNFKKNGWMFISAVLVTIMLPFEIYLMIIDYRIVDILYAGNFNVSYVADLFTKRITILSSFPLLQLFSYSAIIYMLYFKPFTKRADT